jgi:hypothetical protein
VSLEKPRKHEDWQLAEVSESTPYRRTIALSELHDFSERGEYQVQLWFNNLDTGGGGEGGWVGYFYGQVFTVVVKSHR